MNRQLAAKMISEKPEQFKVCRGCESILATSMGVCPFCNAYGFESDTQTIIKRANALAEKPAELQPLGARSR